MLIRNTWYDRFAEKGGGMGDFEKQGDPSHGGVVLKWGRGGGGGVDTLLRTMEIPILFGLLWSV